MGGAVKLGAFSGRGNLENFQGWGGLGQPFFPAPGRGGACIPDILCKSSNHSALVGQNDKEQSFAGNGIARDNTISIIKQNFD